jgi:putative transposase
VIAHAVAAEPLFWDDVDRKVYLGLLQQAIEKYRWTLLTFVLMENHVHLLIVAASSDLSGALWWLHWKYAEHVHRRHPPRRGHVFESRPKTIPIDTESYLLAVLRYIANNPIKACVCSLPEQYRWSAHRAIVGLSAPMPLVARDDVLALFSNDEQLALAQYANFVAGADPVDHEDVRRSAEGPRRDRPPLHEILRQGDPEAAIRLAHVRWDYSMRAIASALGLSPSTISRRLHDST